MAAQQTILIVDDAPENLGALSALLRSHYTVRAARSGAQALRIAAGDPSPALIVLDIMMPDLDGYAVLERLKADPDTREIPVIFITALDAAEEEHRGLELGAVDYITKPINPAVVLARVRTQLELKAARDRLRDENADLEAEVARRNRQREQILLTVAEGTYGTDTEGRISFVNPAAARLLGYGREEMLGRDAHRLFHAEDGDDASGCSLCSCLDGRHSLHRHETGLRHRDGRLLELELTCEPLFDADALFGTVVTFRDISERKRYIAEIERKSNFDDLTGLPNRNLLADRIAQGMKHHRRTGAALAALLLDLDRFKAVNEGLGHAAGDAVLRDAAERLAAAIPAEMTLPRYEGDAFVVFAEVEESTAVTRLAQRLLGVLAEPFRDGERVFYVTASVGAALYPRDGAAGEILLHNADAAMTKAKLAGGNCLRFCSATMNARALERLDLETGLRRAIDEDQLVLHYQPQLSLETGAIVGVEALVRWQHPDRGLLLPGEFIALAEQSDLILSLGEWVLRAACAQNRLWRDAGLPPVQVAVNLSARQFAAQDLPALVSRVLAQTRLGGEALDLELTESMMMLDSDAVARAIDGLRALSVSLSIDDFGTGFSSLGYLRRFAIDRLKIDRSFVSGLPEDTNGAAIATAIVSLGRSLGMTVIAEGVETEAQRDFLHAHGCDQIQGYLFSRPVPAGALAELLQRGCRLALPAAGSAGARAAPPPASG